MSYCSVADVESELGVTLDGDQSDRAETLIAAAQSFIDLYCGQTFEASDPIIGERHPVYGHTLYVHNAPVASVEAVRWRITRIGEPFQTLRLGKEYDVVDLSTGLLRLIRDLYYSEVEIDYTPDISVPADIRDVTAQIVAQRMAPSVAGGTMPDDMKSFQVGTELRMDRFALDEFPPRALQVMDTLKLRVRMAFV